VNPQENPTFRFEYVPGQYTRQQQDSPQTPG
jgi:hypothetical protein